MAYWFMWALYPFFKSTQKYTVILVESLPILNIDNNFAYTIPRLSVRNMIFLQQDRPLL